MKRLTKIVVTLSLVFAGLCYSQKPAKADLFGVTDAALLVQQILQYIQDLDLGDLQNLNLGELVQNIDNKVADMQKIVNIFENGKKGYGVFNNLVEVTRKVTYLTGSLNHYINYLGRMGNDFDIYYCYDIYRNFVDRTKIVLRNTESTLGSIRQLKGEEGSNILNMIDNIIKESSSLIDVISDECLTKLTDEIHRTKMNRQAEKSQNFNTLTIC